MSNSSKNTKTQRERFIDAARDVETDEDPKAFKERLKKLLVAAPTKKSPKRTPRVQAKK